MEDGCQVFLESFLLLSTTSGSIGQVVAPELPNLLSEEESQVLQSHQDQADGALGALDALMARSLAAGQREVSLRGLLDTMQHDQHERHYYKWLIAAIALILILPIVYLTSKCWRQPLLEFASRYVLRRTRIPAKAPVPKSRGKRTCTMPMADEECEMEEKPIMGDAEGTSGRTIADSPAPTEEPAGTPMNPTEGSLGATSTKFPGVRYSQPGRYQT